jgi:hypothetical protein
VETTLQLALKKNVYVLHGSGTVGLPQKELQSNMRGKIDVIGQMWVKTSV